MEPRKPFVPFGRNNIPFESLESRLDDAGKGGEGCVYSSFGCSADSAVSSFGAAGLSSVAAGSSFVTSMSEVQRVRLSRSNCFLLVMGRKGDRVP
jgi:hypothetical protein